MYYAMLVKDLAHHGCDAVFLTDPFSGCCVVECKFCGRCYLVVGSTKLDVACLLWWHAAGV